MCPALLSKHRVLSRLNKTVLIIRFFSGCPVCAGSGLGVAGIKTVGLYLTFISSHALEVRWWTMTSAFGRLKQTDRFTWVGMERKTRERRKTEQWMRKLGKESLSPLRLSQEYEAL